jgi:hypothetical protein
MSSRHGSTVKSSHYYLSLQPRYRYRASNFKLLKSPWNRFRQSMYPEPVSVDLLQSPGIDSQPGGPVRQPYLAYRPARLHRMAESIPRNRFLGSINVYKYGHWWAITTTLFLLGSKPPIDCYKIPALSSLHGGNLGLFYLQNKVFYCKEIKNYISYTFFPLKHHISLVKRYNNHNSLRWLFSEKTTFFVIFFLLTIRNNEGGL